MFHCVPRGVITVALAILTLLLSGPVRGQPPSAGQLRLPFTVQDCNGDRTRALIVADGEGNRTVNPTDAGEGYRTDMIVAISSGFSGSMQPTYWCAGAEQVYHGKMPLAGGYSIESDPTYPLTFKLVKGQGLTYMSGRGIVRGPDDKTVRLGYEHTVDTWLGDLRSVDPVRRAVAAEALGWLTRTSADKERVVKQLVGILTDGVADVRRNTAEALGKIGDQSAATYLASRADERTESDEWVRKVAAEALQRLQRAQK